MTKTKFSTYDMVLYQGARHIIVDVDDYAQDDPRVIDYKIQALGAAHTFWVSEGALTEYR